MGMYNCIICKQMKNDDEEASDYFGTGVACESCRYDADDEGALTQAVIDAAKEWVRANAALRQELTTTIKGSPTDETSALRKFESAQTSLIYAVEQLDE